jgi:Ala-tRNA(Pro) deacylase
MENDLHNLRGANITKISFRVLCLYSFCLNLWRILQLDYYFNIRFDGLNKLFIVFEVMFIKENIEKEGLEKIEGVLKYLERESIQYKIWYHPPLPTIELAMEYWKDMPGTHCKNLFFRNHKGNRHYLVIFECSKELDIHTLEKSLNQGKLSFASAQRMNKFLGVEPGSVTPFGLINDAESHVSLFIDSSLKSAEEISFHPNDNRASVVIKTEDFFRFLEDRGNQYSFIDV